MTIHNPVSKTLKPSELQVAIEIVEALEPESQAILIDVIEKRLKQRRRAELVQTVEDVRDEFARGNFRSGSVSDLLAELDSCPD
jgi:hypothetical protein